MTRRINIATDIIPVSEFRRNTAAIMERLRTEKRPIVLTQNGKSAGVLVNPDDFEALAYEAELEAAVASAEDDFKNGRIFTHEEAKAFIQHKLAAWK